MCCIVVLLAYEGRKANGGVQKLDLSDDGHLTAAAADGDMLADIILAGMAAILSLFFFFF